MCSNVVESISFFSLETVAFDILKLAATSDTPCPAINAEMTTALTSGPCGFIFNFFSLTSSESAPDQIGALSAGRR